MDNQSIKAWMEGKITPAEITQHKSQGDPSVQQLKKIIEKTSHLKVPANISKQQAWEKLSQKIEASSSSKAKTIVWNPWLPVGIAASIALVLISYFIFFYQTTIATQAAEKLSYILPDGSKIMLNANSKATFNRMGWQHDRAITLEGEAFFEVEKGKTFTINGKAGTVTVLGTTFNAQYRNDNLHVACFSGKVKVNANGVEVILEKGQFTETRKHTLIIPEKFTENNEAAWRRGEFYFDSTPINLVMEELERQFNVKIKYTGDPLRLYTGYFNNKSLDDALVMVFKPMSLTYHREGDTIFVP